MEDLSLEGFVAIVGIDWADQKHDLCEWSAKDQSCVHTVITSKPEAIHGWALDIPGAGPQLAPRLLVAFGSQRDRYSSAADLQRYSGVAPVIESSGTKSWTRWRYSCPKFLRQTFVEWAGQSVRYSFWAKAYYDQQKDKGKPHNTIIRSLAYKWIRIVFRCWQERKPYDEATYLKVLQQRHTPLLKFAAEY